MIIAFITVIATMYIEAAPLFDFLPPVVINEDQRITNNHNEHTTIFFPIRKYATDIHYQIIRIPIHLQPIKKGLKKTGEVLH